MLYVSKYNSEKGIYSVTDTDDGVTQHLSRERLLDVVHNLGVNVRGVTGDQIKVLVLKENSNKKPIQKFLAKANSALTAGGDLTILTRRLLNMSAQLMLLKFRFRPSERYGRTVLRF